MTICPPCGQTELGLWPYRPPPDDLVFETLSHPMGASGGPTGIPHDHAGMGEAHRVARRHAEARLEAAARGERRDGNGSCVRPYQGRTRGRSGRGREEKGGVFGRYKGERGGGGGGGGGGPA